MRRVRGERREVRKRGRMRDLSEKEEKNERYE
jgi:hypothetical protein